MSAREQLTPTTLGMFEHIIGVVSEAESDSASDATDRLALMQALIDEIQMRRDVFEAHTQIIARRQAAQTR